MFLWGGQLNMIGEAGDIDRRQHRGGVLRGKGKGKRTYVAAIVMDEDEGWRGVRGNRKHGCHRADREINSISLDVGA